MKRVAAAAAIAVACSSGSGSSPTEPAPVHVIVRAKVGSRLDVRRASIEPNAALRLTRKALDQLELELRPGSGPLRLSLEGACPAELSLADAAPGDRRTITLSPWLSVAGGDLTQVGFDAPFTITLSPGCRDALSSKVEWSQTGGSPVTTTSEQNGFVLHGRTPAFSGEIPPGIVPISQRTRGELLFLAKSGDHSLTVRVSAAARSSGLPSLAVSQRVLLGGKAWRVKERAKDGHAEVSVQGKYSLFQPDARGRWVLEDERKQELSLVVGTHADTLLDCGRADCHARQTEAVKSSRMTHVFERGLRGQISGYSVDCALACHTAGEPGIADGGFSQLSNELGRSGVFDLEPNAWDELPRALRRLGGVTCTACHGPGAIPEPSARWAILRTDVCATCHDAPPRYGHVQAWNTTAMSRADHDDRARREPACRACHTTAGFLAKLNLRQDQNPPELELGIGCAACHAPHADHQEPRLLRQVSLPPGLQLPESAAPSRVCVGCHSGDSASAASVLFGPDPPGAHASVAKGCIGCHAGVRGKSGERGGNHSFAVDRARCSQGCHQEGVPVTDPALRARALALFERLGGSLEPRRPPHAGKLPKPVTEQSREALALVRMVIDDRAAAVHDAKRVRALLSRAESLLGGAR